jgi:hypothetical protein
MAEATMKHTTTRSPLWFLIKYSGIVAIVSLFALVTVSGQIARGSIEPGIIALAALIAFSLSSGAFLYKAYLASRSGAGILLLGYLLGSFGLAHFVWVTVLSMAIPLAASETSFSRLAVLANDGTAHAAWQVHGYVFEQILSGALFDFLESFKVRFSDITYGREEFVMACLTFGMRLTGSVIVGALLLGVFQRGPVSETFEADFGP